MRYSLPLIGSDHQEAKKLAGHWQKVTVQNYTGLIRFQCEESVVGFWHTRVIKGVNGSQGSNFVPEEGLTQFCVLFHCFFDLVHFLFAGGICSFRLTYGRGGEPCADMLAPAFDQNLISRTEERKVRFCCHHCFLVCFA